MKNIFVVAMLLLAGCSDDPKKMHFFSHAAKPATAADFAKMAEDKRKVDSLKKVQEYEIMHGHITDKRQNEFADSIVKWQVEYDSLSLLKK